MNREHLSTLSTRLGGFFGLAYFLLFAVKPAFVYGGMLGVVASSVLHGGPVGAELSTRIMVAVAMLVGVVVTGAALVAAGALAGKLVDAFVLEPMTKSARKSATKAEPATNA